MNVLLIASLPHIRDWVHDAARLVQGVAVDVHDVRHVESGTLVLQARDDIDLVLLDVDGAGLGAIDVERLWSVRRGTNIAVTRWLTSEADLVACVRAGALGYLPKELSASALASAMCVVAQGMLWCPNLRQQREPGGPAY